MDFTNLLINMKTNNLVLEFCCVATTSVEPGSKNKAGFYIPLVFSAPSETCYGKSCFDTQIHRSF